MEKSKVSDRIFKINKAMVIIIWVGTLLQIAFTALIVEDKLLLITTVIPILLVVSTLVTVLHIKRLFTDGIKYIMVFAMILINIIFVHLFGDLNGLVIAYIAIVVIALYQDYKLIVVTGVFCGLSILASFLMGNSANMLGIFNDVSGIINIMVTLGTFTYVVSMNANNSIKIIEEAVEGRKIQEETTHKVSKVLNLLGTSIKELTSIENQLTVNIRNTEEISSDVENSFKNINDISAEQNEAILAVNLNIENQVSEINKVVEDNKDVSEFTSSTEEITAKASQKVSQLSKDMNKIKNGTEEAVVSIEEFIGYTKDVQAVLESVNKISEQINLLALNASIEAARAGEHGKGFAVVANEVGKLAEESKNSTTQIEDILSRITVKADDVYNEIEDIRKNTESSSDITLEVVDIFENLKDGAIHAAESSRRAVAQAIQAKSYSEIATSNVSVALTLSESSSETVEDAMKKIEEQSHVVKKMVDKSEELESLINQMKEES